MNSPSRLSYLELALTPYVGPVSLLKLLQRFEDISAVWSASANQLNDILTSQAISAIHKRQGQQALQDALAWESKAHNHRLLCLLDEDYPMNLAQIDAPPSMLFVKGQCSLLHQHSIAIVGSRHATAQGLKNAQQFAHALSQKGLVIVSGMASGIDTAAHQGTLEANGHTMAVIGTGIDRVYPASNRALAHQICENGLLVSEFPLQTPPVASNFPRRNRIIAALSEAVLVVEAAKQSGSLITAQLALEMNKDVMAIPGSIHNTQSKGCHALIKQGAKLVECSEDILEELQISPQTKPLATCQDNTPLINSNKPSSKLLEQMGFDPIHPDQLVDKLGISATDVYAELLELELQGLIALIAGGRYQRIH